MLYIVSSFPLNRYHGIEPATALADQALLLVAFLPIVFLPMIAVALAVRADVPTALDALCHPPARTHQPRDNLNHPSFLAHFHIPPFLQFRIPNYRHHFH